jgi:hypothetical protein
MKKNYFLLPLFLLATIATKSQDIAYARKTINTLCSPEFHGRGYVNGGDAKAASFIYEELKKLKGIKVQYQSFPLTVNTFPKSMMVKVNHNTLKPGIDYIVKPTCPTISKRKYNLLWLTNDILQSEEKFSALLKKTPAYNHFIVIDTLPKGESEARTRAEKYVKENISSGVIHLTNDKLIWSVASKQGNSAELYIKADKLPRNATTIEIHVDAKLTQNYLSQNVLGFIKGTQYPDSIITLTAHYDHLGRMGKDTYFPGANDNASGTAMLLDMANYYSEHPPKFSILFIAFGAEEAGLIGSNYYVNADPKYPLYKMKFLINMDLMATGAKGLMAVNGLVFEEEYKALVAINNEKNYLSEIKARGKAANSDHYWFTEQGVHSFFFYLMGDFPSYHDPGDKAGIVPLTEYEDSFKLIRDFIDYLQD